MVGSQALRNVVRYFKSKYKISERRACEQVKISRSTYRYKGSNKNDRELITKILNIAKKHSYYGYRRIYI